MYQYAEVSVVTCTILFILTHDNTCFLQLCPVISVLLLLKLVCSFSKLADLTSSANTTLIIAIIVASVVGAFICLLIVTVPLCICCCLGIGISASSNRNKPSKTVVNQPAATTTVITTTNEKLSNPQEDKTPAAAYPAQAAPLPYKEAYPTQPVYPQQQQQPYPPQGYPPQEYPPQGYPPQEYPPQGYPPQEYPPLGYPPQEYPPQPYPPQEYPAQ